MMDAIDFKANYRELTSSFPNHEVRPVIAISGNYGDKGCELADGYYRSVEAAGGIPLVIPPLTDHHALLGLLDRVDGILLSGGADINPLCVDEEPLPTLHGINARRDAYELLLVQLAADRNIPLLGICRGIQVIAAALGGRVCQDLGAEHPEWKLLKHSQDAPRYVSTHLVKGESDSVVGALLGTRFAVNSFHHQAVDQTGEKFRVTAQSSDGVIEAIESADCKPIVGVQWHPECYILEGDQCMLPLFRWLVGQAAGFRQARELHRHMLTLDSHCDTPMCFEKGATLHRRDNNCCVDLHKMTEGGLDASIMVAYLPQGGRSEAELAAATHKAETLLESIRQEVAAHPQVQLAQTPADLYRAKAAGKRSILLGIENGYAIGRDLSQIARFREAGVVYMTLCHNGDNDICDAASRSQQEHNGLSDFGRAVVAEMNRVGMLIDLSHASEKTFYDVLETSRFPVVCSHSSSRHCCNHLRNLTDDQLRAIAAKGGVVQVTFYDYFLKETGGATIEDAVRHLLHVIAVAGVEHTGIGTDFDGDGGVPGIRNAADCIHLTQRLLEAGLTAADLRRIWGENFLRVMEQVQRR